MRVVLRLMMVVLVVAAVRPGAVATQELGPQFDRPSWMIGFVANAPQMPVGASVALLPPVFGGWGAYFDAKSGVDSPGSQDNFRDDLTPGDAEALNDPSVGDTHSYRSFNAGLVRVFRDDIVVYLGAGAARERVFVEYYDSNHDRGHFGYYYVEDEPLGGWRVNVLGGTWFRAGRHIAFQFGAESMPVGFTVGVSAVF